MLAVASQLAQIRPSVTTSVTAFTGVLPVTEVTRIVVCNTTGSPANLSVFHDDDGTAYGAASALYWNQTLAANSTLEINFAAGGGGISVKAGGTIGVGTSVANALTFTLYGVTADITGQVRT